MNVSDLRVMGRATQGVRLINIQDSDAIAAVTKVDHEDEEVEFNGENGTDSSNENINSEENKGEGNNDTQ